MSREVLDEVADRLEDAVDLTAQVDRSRRHVVKLSRLAAAQSRWSALAPTLLAAALAAAYLALGPVERRSRGADVPRRPVRRRTASCSGTTPGTRATYVPLLQRALPAAGRPARPAARRRARGRRGGGLFALLVRRRLRRPGLRGDRCGSRPRPAARLLTGRHDVPARGAVRARGAARGRLRRRRCWAALAAALASLASPVAGLFVALAGVRDRARRRAPARRGARDRRRAADRRPQPRLPDRRRGAVRVLGLHRDPDPGRGAWSGSCPREDRALRIGAVLYALARDRRSSSSPTRWAGTSPASGRCSPGRCWRSCSPAGGWSCSRVSVPLLYWQWVAPVRDVPKAAGDPSTEQAFYAAAARRARPADGDRGLVPGRGPAHEEPLGGRLRGAATTRSPAAGCASSSPTTSTCSRTTT